MTFHGHALSGNDLRFLLFIIRCSQIPPWSGAIAHSSLSFQGLKQTEKLARAVWNDNVYIKFVQLPVATVLPQEARSFTSWLPRLTAYFHSVETIYTPVHRNH